MSFIFILYSSIEMDETKDVFLQLKYQQFQQMNISFFQPESVDGSQLDKVMGKTARTLSPELEEQIKNKYRTFANFNYRQTYRQHRQSRKKKQSDLAKILPNNIADTLASFMIGSLIQQKSKKKKVTIGQQLAGVKSERRERFKKATNTFQIIKHYIQKQNFKPTEEQMYLMKSLAELKQVSEQSNLDSILKKIYKYMNEAVDLNEMRFLCLVIVLAADICFQFKDFKRSFYFYHQAKMFSSYADVYNVKTEALMAMGNICMEIKFYLQAIKIYKKALQYSWKTRNIQNQLLIYDCLGSAYYYQGSLKESQYYHKRFTQGEFEGNDSAIKKISAEMLLDYEKHISSLQKKNLTSLFLEYINIPIVDLGTIPPPPDQRKVYQNYGEESLSPRRKRGKKIHEFEDFPQINKQIASLLNDDYEFKTEIPNPDVQQNYHPTIKYGKQRKDVIFEQTAEYHKIMGHRNTIDLSQIHSDSLQKRIEAVLNDKPNKDWWFEIKDKIRKNQLQKVGRLRDRIFNCHLSYSKDKRRSFSLKNQKIKQSFNKTLLDWIDPPK